MFGRNYKPVYSNTHEDYTKRVREMLESSLYVKLVNEQPYNTYTNNGVTTEHNTEHYTMFYRYEDRYNQQIREQIRRHLDEGYTVMEAGDDKKSIHLPHFHFVRII